MKYFIYRHKSIVTAIISIIAMCGCANDEIEVPTKHEDKLYFNATIDRRADQQLPTRAYTGDIDFAVPGFTVAGYYTNGEFSTSNPNSLPFPNVFDYLNPGVDKAVINVEKDNNETNTNRQYWTKLPRLPLSNIFCISYFAWSSSIPASIKAATSTSAHKGAPWIDAQVGAANVDQPDIVGAVSMNHNNEYTVSAIDLDFKHLLSKMSFKVKASNDMRANITKVECIYAPSAVYSEARFTFDGSADVGSWGGHKSYLSASTVQASGWNTITTTTAPALLGSMTFIPQSLTDDALKLKVTYTTTQDGATSSETSRIVSLKALDMEAGKNYVYTLDIKANEIAIFNVTVESWIEIAGTDQGLPLVPGEMDPNVLLLLEGTDPPYTTADGNKYWLDRSGWNRHCLIVDKMHYSGTNSFDITYDQEAKGYHIPKIGSTNLYNHIRIPDLGSTSGDFTYEVVCTHTMTSSADPYPFILHSQNPNHGWGTNPTANYAFIPDISYVAGNMAWKTPSNDENFTVRMGDFPYNNKAYYYGVRSKNSLIKMGFNNTNMGARRTSPSQDAGWNIKGGYIGPQFSGTINYLKLMKKASSDDELLTNYTELKKKYSIPQSSAPANYYLPPVTDGLVFAFDGRSSASSGTWTDLSGRGNHMTRYSNSGTYDSSDKAIVHNGQEANCWKIDNDISGLSTWTINAVVKATYPSTGKEYPLFFFGVGQQTTEANKYIYLAYPNPSGNVVYKSFNSIGIEINWSSVINSKHQLQIRRQPTITRLGLNNDYYYTTRGHDNATSPTMSVIWIGARAGNSDAWHGRMYSFRMYSRDLTDAESKLNYEYDKKAHNF